MSHAFDTPTIDDLLFLATPQVENLAITGDGVLKFSRLIAAGLATFNLFIQNGPLFSYTVSLTPKGTQLMNAWRGGDRKAVAEALGDSYAGVEANTPARIP